MTIEWYDWCGYAGVVAVLLAFFLLQAQRIHSHGWIYQLLNVLGAVGIMISLLFGTFNLPAFVLEVIWALIGIYGIVVSQRRRRNRPRGETDART